MAINNTSEEVAVMNQRIESLFLHDMLLSKIAYGILCILCVVILIIAVYKLIRRRWTSIFFIFLCTSVILWSAISLFALFSDDYRVAEFLNSLRYISLVPIPALLMLHIILQVSYKGLRSYITVIFLTVPALYMLLILRDLYIPNALAFLPAITATPVYAILFYLFTLITLIKSYLLCFNVFYQMPPRTRRSTKSIFVSVVTLTLMAVIYALWVLRFGEILLQIEMAEALTLLQILLPLAIPIALGVLVYPLYDSMSIMPASDVIVTSREFIMRGLNTTVFVLNRKHQILDWNKKDWESGFPLPKPKYKEIYHEYLKRVLTQYSGKVSPHTSEIVIITKEGKEVHFLQRTYEIGYKKKMFGYVVEITEITAIYSKLRYFEQIAHIDTLTGLHNRNAYLDYTQQLIKEENMPLTILVGDLNELKRINDVYGHLEGDELIKTVAKVILEAKPENGFVSRLGGDEFAVLVPNSNEGTADEFIKKAILLCGENKDERQHAPSISWGHALMTSTEQSYNDLFAEADKMMYEFKKERVAFSSSGLLHSIEPTHPEQPVSTEEPAPSEEPAQPTEPAQPEEPAEPVTSEEPMQPTETAQPEEPVAPEEPTQPEQPAED